MKVVKNCHISGQVHWISHSEWFAINLASGSFHNVKIRKGTAVADIKLPVCENNIDYGHYLFMIRGNIEGQPATNTSSFGYIEVTSTNLVANITGATRACQGNNETLILNGSLSHDPDVGPGKYTGIEFTWVCTRNNERFPNNITALTYVFPRSGSTSLLGQDRGGCYGTGVGKLKPRHGMAYIADLNVDKMKGDQYYVIKLIMKKRGLTVSAVRNVGIKEINLTIV